MNSIETQTIGIGLYTQYCVLKFIQETSPDRDVLVDFVHINSASFYPPFGGYSMTKYLSKILDLEYIYIDENDKVIIGEIGEKKLSELKKHMDEIEAYEQRLPINYSVA